MKQVTLYGKKIILFIFKLVKNYSKILCFFGIHNYEYSSIRKRVYGIKHLNNVKVHFRKCKNCAKTQQKTMVQSCWKNYSGNIIDGDLYAQMLK